MLYFGTQYITQTLTDIDYFARISNVVQQKLRAYILAMPEVMWVTTALTSVTFVEPAPNACKHIDYPHLYKEQIILV